MTCKVCGAPGARFCLPCRRRYGGRSVMVERTSAPRRLRSAAAPLRRKRKAAATAGKRAPLSREAFLRRMKLGRQKAARARARGKR